MAVADRWPTRLGMLALGAFVAGPLLAHLHVLPAFAGFLVFALGGLLGVFTLIASIVAAIRHGTTAARTGLIIGAGLSALFIVSALPGRNVPRINDITTDTTNPPPFVQAGTLAANRGRNMGYAAGFAAQQKAGYPALGPLRVAASPEETFKRVEAAARQFPDWELTRVDPTAHAIEGVATSRLFRFQDDFVIEVRADGGGSLVQMRSKSRVGKGDVGANAARIESLFARLR